MPTAVLLSQGDEVVTGQIVDTNAAWLADQLTGLGFDVVSHVTVGDRLPDLVRALEAVCAAGDVVVCTGGLGPTDDDLTGEAASRAFGVPLRFDDRGVVPDRRPVQPLRPRDPRGQPQAGPAARGQPAAG